MIFNSAQKKNLFANNSGFVATPLIVFAVIIFLFSFIFFGIKYKNNSTVKSDNSFDVGHKNYASPITLTDSTSSQSTSQSLFDPNVVFLSPVDQRFGVNGGCPYAQLTGTTWTYNWGWMTNTDRINMQPDNINEVRCYSNTQNTANPINTLITLAKNDGVTTDLNPNSFAAWSETDVANWLNKAKNDNKIDAEDLGNFEALTLLFPDPSVSPVCDIYTTVQNACGPNHPKRLNVARIKANYLQIPYIVARYPGAHYQIANEPEFGFSYFPNTYAKMYKLFYDRIKKFDPDAKVSIGALGMVEFDHPFNANEPTFKKNTAYDWIMAELKAKGLSNTVYGDVAWFALVHKEYTAEYKVRSIPMDFFSIHPYPWPPEITTDTYKKRTSTGAFYSYQFPPTKVNEAVNDTIAQINKFKTGAQKLSPNYNSVPIWLTELNVLVNKNATPAERDAEAANVQLPYLRQVYTKLLTVPGKPTAKPLVQKIFWHTGLHEAYQPANHIESGFVFPTTSRPSGMNLLAEEIVNQRQSYKDSRAPEIIRYQLVKLNIKKIPHRRIVLFAVDRPGTNESASGIHKIHYTIFNSDLEQPLAPSNKSLWKSVLTTNSSVRIEVSLENMSTQNLWFAVRVEDAYGNISPAMVKKSL